MDIPLIFGHRGAAGLYVENTLNGFQRALEIGVDGFESDVYITLDGVPFLMHDNKCKLRSQTESVRTTALKAADLEKIILPKDEKVPTFEEFLEKFRGKKTRAGKLLLFSLDLGNPGAAMAASVLIQKYGMEDQMYITDKWAVNFRAVRKVSTKIHLIATNSIRPLTLNTSHLPISHYVHYGIEGFNIKAAKFERRQADVFTQHGYKFLIWDLHTEEALRKYFPYHPWGIYTNYPDLAIKIRAEIFNSS
jgi:glycerophosphoryl diester phosphodiesterase